MISFNLVTMFTSMYNYVALELAFKSDALK